MLNKLMSLLNLLQIPDEPIKQSTPIKVLPWSIYEHPRYRAQVINGNLVNLFESFPCRDLAVWILLKKELIFSCQFLG